MRLAEIAAEEAAEAAAAADPFAGAPGACLLKACTGEELALIAKQVRSLASCSCASTTCECRGDSTAIPLLAPVRVAPSAPCSCCGQGATCDLATCG